MRRGHVAAIAGVYQVDSDHVDGTAAAHGSSREEFERLAVTSKYSYERRVLSTVSAGVVFHARTRGRWTPLFYAGVTNNRVVDDSSVVPVAFP